MTCGSFDIVVLQTLREVSSHSVSKLETQSLIKQSSGKTLVQHRSRLLRETLIGIRTL